jgi:hypothetical protein
MTIYQLGLLAILLSLQTNLSAQRLKKADRTIVSNIKTHVKSLGDSAEYQPGSPQEKAAAEYIGRQFVKYGLKPMSGQGNWFQEFTINDGKEILPATNMSINGKNLSLYSEYFPLPFSANKNAEAAVAIALAENGVPWFKSLGEILDKSNNSSQDTMEIIFNRAQMAAQKGASALIIYNDGDIADLAYARFNRLPDVSIPVLYITADAFKKHCPDNAEIIDVALNVDKEIKTRKAVNVIGYDDNGADSTIVATADLNNSDEVAALMEVARLLRQGKNKKSNYLFIAYSGDNHHRYGADYYHAHPIIRSAAVSRMVDLDTVSVDENRPEGLNLVRQSVELIR